MRGRLAGAGDSAEGEKARQVGGGRGVGEAGATVHVRAQDASIFTYGVDATQAGEGLRPSLKMYSYNHFLGAESQTIA